LKLKFDKVLSTFAFKFNFRRYSLVTQQRGVRRGKAVQVEPMTGLGLGFRV
jgi:hypothetical protein